MNLAALHIASLSFEQIMICNGIEIRFPSCVFIRRNMNFPLLYQNLPVIDLINDARFNSAMISYSFFIIACVPCIRTNVIKIMQSAGTYTQQPVSGLALVHHEHEQTRPITCARDETLIDLCADIT